METEMGQASHFQMHRLWSVLLKFWWILLITVGLGLVAGGAFVYLKPPTYVSKARMWETLKLHLPEGGIFSEDVQNFLGTQSELLQSPTLREMALARLSTNQIDIPRGKNGRPLPVTVRIAATPKSTIYTLEASSYQAAFTRAYLDALMDVYLDYKRNVRKEVSGLTLASINEEVQTAEGKLKVEQDKQMQFERTNNIASLQQEGAVEGAHLATLKTRLSDYQRDQRLLESTISDQAAEGENNHNRDAIADLINADSLAGSGQSVATTERHATIKELEILKIQRARLSRNLRPKHPKIVKLDADIERAEQLLDVYSHLNRDQLAAFLQSLQLRIGSLESSIADAEKKVAEANNLLAEAEHLKLNVQREQINYDRLAMLLRNVGISRNIDQDNLSILDPAGHARRSYRDEIGAMLVAPLGGLGLGAGILLLILLRDDRFESASEVNEKLGELVVGQVPQVPGCGRNGQLPLLEMHDQRHAYAESYRNLRSAVLFMAVAGQRPKVILITSAVPNEGKSTVAANLARALALGGARVVLVDGDLRKGVLHELLGLPRGPGLADALETPTELESVLLTGSVPRFSFIPSGNLSSNSGDLFLGSNFDQVLEQLKRQFDYVIIDSSPVFAADDATTLAPKADATLFVVSSGYSRAKPVREALNTLYQRQAKIMGVVFNRADASARSYYYYKYAEYYGYGEPRPAAARAG
jgi:capsular exopolysaccharide synthesis family protein